MTYNVYIWRNDNELYSENWIYSVIVIRLPRELTLSNIVSNSLQILISWFLFVTLKGVSDFRTFVFDMLYFGRCITFEFGTHDHHQYIWKDNESHPQFHYKHIIYKFCRDVHVWSNWQILK